MKKTILMGILMISGVGATQAMADGYVFTATNATENAIMVYHRGKDGKLTEDGMVQTGGKGTNGAKPVTGGKSVPDPLTSSDSIVMSDDHKQLFVVNAGDNTVSSFAVGAKGKLTLVDTHKSGGNTPVSLAYNGKDHILYVMHSFGPNHVTALAVKGGKLSTVEGGKTVNTAAANDRIPTQIVVTPDDKFAIVSVLFNARPAPGPNGPVVTPSNAGAKDGFVVLPIGKGGALGEPKLQDSGAPTPFAIKFLDHTNKFVAVYAAGNGAAMGSIGANGTITTGPLAKVNDSAWGGKPLELCWLSFSPDRKYTYVTSYGLGRLMSFSIGKGISLVNDKVVEVPATTDFKAFADVPSSGPSDQWSSKDGYLYQLYSGAATLVSYKMDGKGGLTEIGRTKVAQDAPQGMTGF